MFNFYDRCESIDFKGSRNENWTHFPYVSEVKDVGDSVTISTEVVVDYIDRGWLGDITFNLAGYSVEVESWERTAFQKVVLKDMLCIRRTFSKDRGSSATWTYTFLKY